MDGAEPTAETVFAVVVAAFARTPGVTLPGGPSETGKRRFGADALKVGGSIFAMLVDDRLVVKLPRDRVAELIEAGAGASFETHPGRPMKEWVSLDDVAPEAWLALSHEALTFVRSLPATPGGRAGRRR